MGSALNFSCSGSGTAFRGMWLVYTDIGHHAVLCLPNAVLSAFPPKNSARVAALTPLR
jgi:hypothetical protein